MKKVWMWALAFVLLFTEMNICLAAEATPQEVVAKVQQAAQLIAEKGDQGLAAIQDIKGPFVWKDTYVFVFDLNGTVVAHPVKPHLVGKNLMGIKDIKGKMFAAEFVAIAKSPEGKGWCEYWWPKPGAKTPSLKTSYIMKVPGKDYLVAAGLYDVSQADAEKALAQ